MPPQEIWIQYPIIAILILAAGVIAAAFYRLWRELLAWIEMQDKKREAERERQREWEARQLVERETERERQRAWEAQQLKENSERWQEFIQALQDSWLAQDGKNSEVLKQLVSKINDLTVAVNNHDTWARAKDRP